MQRRVLGHRDSLQGILLVGGLMSVGLLITYYNEKELLGRCLRSLFDEKGPPDEVLVYDDCSAHPAENYVPPHLKGRVEVVRSTKNLGPAKGRNILLKRSTADYVKFQDTDDELKTGWSEVLRSRALAHPDVVLFEVDSFREDKPYRQCVLGLKDILHGMDPVVFAIHNAIVTSSALYRRKFLDKTGPYREDLWQSEDHEFHIRVLSHRPVLDIVQEPLLNLHVRNESRSQKHLEVWQCRLKGLQICASFLESKYRDELAEAGVNVGSNLFSLGDETGAKEAFSWANAIGRPRYAKRSWAYRQLAQWDPILAEQLGKFYRRTVTRGAAYSFS